MILTTYQKRISEINSELDTLKQKSDELINDIKKNTLKL